MVVVVETRVVLLKGWNVIRRLGGNANGDLVVVYCLLVVLRSIFCPPGVDRVDGAAAGVYLGNCGLLCWFDSTRVSGRYKFVGVSGVSGALVGFSSFTGACVTDGSLVVGILRVVGDLVRGGFVLCVSVVELSTLGLEGTLDDGATVVVVVVVVRTEVVDGLAVVTTLRSSSWLAWKNTGFSRTSPVVVSGKNEGVESLTCTDGVVPTFGGCLEDDGMSEDGVSRRSVATVVRSSTLVSSSRYGTNCSASLLFW